VGTLVYRIIPAPRQQLDAAKAPAEARGKTKPETTRTIATRSATPTHGAGSDCLGEDFHA